MAPAAGGAKPKRKRQRRRRDVSDSSSSSSSDSEEEVAPPPKLPTPSASSSASSSEASSSSSDESSEDERAKRKGKGKGPAQQPNGPGSTPSADAARRPYPARSPSPPIFDPANLPLGQSPFPFLKALAPGPILQGKVPGDEGFAGTSTEGGETVDETARAREDKFGEWWRARLVTEFETELGGLAAEPGLTAPRLSLLLNSLTSLSTLHTTSSSIAAATRSIWLHDPSTAIDPFASLGTDEAVEDWGKAPIGGEGDVEVGEEGVSMDLKATSAMDVDLE